MSPNTSAVLGSVPPRRLGTASATLAQMRINGQALGIAASGAVVALRLPGHLAELAGQLSPEAAQGAAFGLAVRDAFVVAAIVCCVAIVTSLVRGGGADAARAPGVAPGAPRGPAAPREPGAPSGPADARAADAADAADSARPPH